MKDLKRRMTALSLALLLIGCLTACGTSERNTAASTQSSTVAPFDGSPELGDTMPELTFTTAEGETVSLSQLLGEKKLVVLNFWFANCTWCLREFPVMEVAYQRYQQDVEILAVNPVDSASDIRAFREEKAYSFPMAPCSRELALSFGVTGYPTSVFIDREGTICLIHTGAITDVSVFDRVFETFTADDYQQKLYKSVEELL